MPSARQVLFGNLPKEESIQMDGLSEVRTNDKIYALSLAENPWGERFSGPPSGRKTKNYPMSARILPRTSANSTGDTAPFRLARLLRQSRLLIWSARTALRAGPAINTSNG